MWLNLSTEQPVPLLISACNCPKSTASGTKRTVYRKTSHQWPDMISHHAQKPEKETTAGSFPPSLLYPVLFFIFSPSLPSVPSHIPPHDMHMYDTVLNLHRLHSSHSVIARSCWNTTSAFSLNSNKMLWLKVSDTVAVCAIFLL